MTQSPSSPDAAAQKFSRSEIKSESIHAGLDYFTRIGLVWVPVWFLAHKFSPAFRTSLSASAKTASLISPPLMGFVFGAEMKASRMARPDAYRDVAQTSSSAGLAMHKRLANYYYTHPFNVLGGVGAIAIGSIFASKKNSSVSFSQKVMQTRVQGQFGVVLLVLSTFGFMEFMRNRGGEFKE